MKTKIFAAAIVLLVTTLSFAQAQSTSACDGGFEMSKDCISERGLDGKVTLFQANINEGMAKLGASYKIKLLVVDNRTWGPYGTPTDADVWTTVVRNAEMRNESFVIHVTAKFLKEQPDILFESSSIHEVCHIVNDDLQGYRRQASNVEVAEERCVADVVGMQRYEEYLRAYLKYKPSSTITFESFLQQVKDVVLVPPPTEMDDADISAADWFKSHADGNEHLLVYNGQVHDITLSSNRSSVRHDPAKLAEVIRMGKPMIFFHNHPSEDGNLAMFPSYSDYGVAGLFSFLVYKENPNITLEFRVMQIGSQGIANVSYGFKQPVIEDIKKNAAAYRDAVAANADVAPIELKQNILNYHVGMGSFNEYLQYACRVELTDMGKKACKTEPQRFLWPSDKYYLHDRPFR